MKFYYEVLEFDGPMPMMRIGWIISPEEIGISKAARCLIDMVPAAGKLLDANFKPGSFTATVAHKTPDSALWILETQGMARYAVYQWPAARAQAAMLPSSRVIAL